jgi:hypothetical protein
MYVPECSIPGTETKRFLTWEGMWKFLIGLAVLDTNRFVTRCKITPVWYQEPACFLNKFMLIGKQIFYFLIQNWQSGHDSGTERYIPSPCTLVL